MSDRTRRQEAILNLLRDRQIKNQNELVLALKQAGYSMTQSTLSRELKSLGIAKTPDIRGGGYRYLVGGMSTRGPLSPVVTFVETIERTGNLIVVKTPPGNAQGVAHGLDEVKWGEVMGTIAGDDTILLICRSNRDGAAVEKRIRALVSL